MVGEVIDKDPGVGVGVGVGVGAGVGVEVAVVVGLGIGVGVALRVGSEVGVEVGAGAGVGVALGVGVGVGAGVGVGLRNGWFLTRTRIAWLPSKRVARAEFCDVGLAVSELFEASRYPASRSICQPSCTFAESQEKDGTSEDCRLCPSIYSMISCTDPLT